MKLRKYTETFLVLFLFATQARAIEGIWQEAKEDVVSDITSNPLQRAQDIYQEGKKVREQLGQEAGAKEYFDAYINRWKEVIKAFDWEKFKLRLQEELGTSLAGRIATIKESPLKTDGGYRMSPVEQEVISKRRLSAGNALKKLTRLKNADTLNVAIACAGGGYTGLISSAAYLSAFEQNGFLDGCLYCAASSGSTWTVGSWYLQQLKRGNSFSCTEFKEMLREKVQNKEFNWFGFQKIGKNKEQHLRELKLFLETTVWPKVVFGQIVSAVDFVGSMIAQFLLADFGDEKYMQHMSYLWPVVAQGAFAWPIFTAISMQKDASNQASYHVYEFNPDEVRNCTLNLGFEVYGFDKKFVRGSTFYGGGEGKRLMETRDIAPETSFASLLAMFGSKYSASWEDIKRLLLEGDSADDVIASFFGKSLSWLKEGIKTIGNFITLAKEKKEEDIWKQFEQDVNKVKAALFVKAIESAAIDKTFTIGRTSFTLGGTMRISPAQIHNPFNVYSGVSSWLRLRDFLTFVDASFLYDVPLLPLLSPERKIDLIVVCDPYFDDDNMKAAFAHVKDLKGIAYKQVVKEDSWSMYKPEVQKNKKDAQKNGEKLPTIVRVFPSPQASVSSSSVEGQLSETMAQLKKINPFDMSYSSEEFDTLVTMCENAVQEALPKIKNVLKDSVHAREIRKVTGFGG